MFPQSDKVNHKKVTFKKRNGIELAADMYTPNNAKGKLAAIAVSGPFGAVKEQTSGLYAQHMAERGFLTMSLSACSQGNKKVAVVGIQQVHRGITHHGNVRAVLRVEDEGMFN